MSDSAHPRKRWIDAWLHSDLIEFPVTLAAVAIASISFGLFVAIDSQERLRSAVDRMLGGARGAC